MCLPAGKRSLEGLEEAIGRPGARILIVSRDSSDIRTHVARSIQGGYYPARLTLVHSGHDTHVYAENIVEKRSHTKVISNKEEYHTSTSTEKRGCVPVHLSPSNLAQVQHERFKAPRYDRCHYKRSRCNEAYQRLLQAIAHPEDDDEEERAIAMLLGGFSFPRLQNSESVDCIRRQK